VEPINTRHSVATHAFPPFWLSRTADIMVAFGNRFGSTRADSGRTFGVRKLNPGNQLVFGNETRTRSGQTLHARSSRTEQLTNTNITRMYVVNDPVQPRCVRLLWVWSSCSAVLDIEPEKNPSKIRTYFRMHPM